MPDYEYRCPTCGTEITLAQPMNADHTPPLCVECRTRTQRVYGSVFHCDEIRGTRYFDPRVMAERRDHGKYFDIGSGRWVRSKSERKRTMQTLGLKEYGPTKEV